MPIEDADRKRIVQAIRTYIARERISREEFARRTRLGKSTVDKLVVGIFSEKTILQIEAQTKISLLGSSPAVEAAGDDFGRYTKEDTKNYIGELQMEMKRVTWPNRKQVESTTAIVILTVFAFAAYFKVVDTVLFRAVSSVQNAFKK